MTLYNNFIPLEPLKRKLTSRKDGKPLKTKVAELLPTMSRRDRRQLIRDEQKKQKKKGAQS